MTQSPAIVILSDAAKPMARRIAIGVGGQVHGLARRVTDGVDETYDDVGAHLSALFLAGRPVIAVMAAGAVIRLLAPHLMDKMREPPVLTVSEDGSTVVPLLGGHHGANDLARQSPGIDA